MTRLYLIRHGSTDLNHEHRYQGKTDLPLSTEGKAEIRKLKKLIKRIHFDLVLISPSKRSHQTSQLLFDSKVPKTVHLGLSEINFGIWEGLTYEQIQSQYPQQLLDYEQDPLTHAPKGGETFAAILDRIKILHGEIFSTYKGKTIAMVSHGGFISIFLCYLFGIKPQTPWQFKLPPASMIKIVIYPNNKVVMEL